MRASRKWHIAVGGLCVFHLSYCRPSRTNYMTFHSQNQIKYLQHHSILVDVRVLIKKNGRTVVAEFDGESYNAGDMLETLRPLRNYTSLNAVISAGLPAWWAQFCPDIDAIRSVFPKAVKWLAVFDCKNAFHSVGIHPYIPKAESCVSQSTEPPLVEPDCCKPKVEIKECQRWHCFTLCGWDMVITIFSTKLGGTAALRTQRLLLKLLGGRISKMLESSPVLKKTR